MKKKIGTGLLDLRPKMSVEYAHVLHECRSNFSVALARELQNAVDRVCDSEHRQSRCGRNTFGQHTFVSKFLHRRKILLDVEMLPRRVIFRLVNNCF